VAHSTPPIVLNGNTDTILVKKPFTQLLPDCPTPSKAIHNICKLKSQLELVQYLHVAAGIPTKPLWIEEIKQAVRIMAWPHRQICCKTLSQEQRNNETTRAKVKERTLIN
jgi:hypothetical protein